VDFGGFRTVLLYPRHKPEYPPKGAYETATAVPPRGLGGTKPPLPDLLTKGTKPVAAATIRVGQGYLEIPFFATSDSHRGKGYGRCLLEAIEQVCLRSLCSIRQLAWSMHQAQAQTKNKKRGKNTTNICWLGVVYKTKLLSHYTVLRDQGLSATTLLTSRHLPVPTQYLTAVCSISNGDRSLGSHYGSDFF
jgi:GNAT superfamily N-acetyltransferase